MTDQGILAEKLMFVGGPLSGTVKDEILEMPRPDQKRPKYYVCQNPVANALIIGEYSITEVHDGLAVFEWDGWRMRP